MGIRIGIIGWKHNDKLIELIRQLGLSSLEIVDFQSNSKDFHDLNTVIFTDIDLGQLGTDKNSEIDKIRDLLSQTTKLLLVNLQDEWVAEITKEIMKKSAVTVLDYNRNHFGNAHDFEKAVYLIGIANGLAVEEIKRRLENE